MYKGRSINKEYKESGFENEVNENSSGRLDLNVLLERLESETKLERKRNYIILSAVISITIVMVLLFYI